MQNELDALERKIAQVAALCHALRAENQQFRQQFATIEAEKRALGERMEAARARLERLAERLPETPIPA